MMIRADARKIPLRDESVHMVCTSPPYWGLRQYGEDTELTWADGWHGQLGLEPTIELYVQHIVEIFREVWRVLRKDGTVWLNLGDSYAGSAQGWGHDKQYAGPKQSTNRGSLNQPLTKAKIGFQRPVNYISSRQENGLKPKDLCGMPWRVGFALQAEGWWVRSEIIWSKPNPMPESVTDRPTRSHEYIFLLTKSERYFYDQEAVREPSLDTAGIMRVDEDGRKHYRKPWIDNKGQDPKSMLGSWASKYGSSTSPNGRNLRSVWTFATEAFPEAHFATFPEDLVKPCILAGTSEAGCCVECAAPWQRIVEKRPRQNKPTGWQEGPGSHDTIPQGRYGGKWAETDPQSSGQRMLANLKAARDDGREHDKPFLLPKTIGWQPTCKCETKQTKPCVVLDPFVGSGTTVKVAKDLGRIGIGLDLKWEYLKMATRRSAQEGLKLGVKGEENAS